MTGRRAAISTVIGTRPSQPEQTATPYGAAPKHRSEKRPSMAIGIAHLSPTLSIIFGVLILIMPRFLNYFVAIYLILAGLLGLGAIR